MFNRLAPILLTLALTLHIPVHFVIAAEYRLRVEVTVPVDRANRMLLVEWDGDGGEGHTSRQLDEYVDWTRHTFTILLRPGAYAVRARLIKAGGKEEVTAPQEVEIVESVPQGE